MVRVIAALIRHGEYHQLRATPSAHQPFPLSEEGEAQAREAVARLRRDAAAHGWALHPVIDSSRLLRAWQTARIIADGLAPLLAEPGLVESFDDLAERGLGSAANLTTEQIEEVLERDPRFAAPPPGWKSDSRYRLPLQGAESLLDAGARVAGHLRARMRALADAAARDTVRLFVGHGAAFRHAAHHLGVLALGRVAQLSMFHARPVYLECLPGGEWRHVAGDWKVRTASEIRLD